MITIYCIIHNREKYISCSLSSLLEYAPSSAKIILVNDKSTDNSLNEVYKITENDIRCKVINNEKNIGFTKSLTQAINSEQRASGNEYLAIFGCGDLLLPTRIEKQVSFLNENLEYSFVASRHSNVTQDGLGISETSFCGVVRSEHVNNSPPSWTHGSVMYRYEDYLKVGGYSILFEYCQDWELYKRLLELKSGYVLNEVLYKKVVFRDGASINPEKRVKQLVFSHKIIGKKANSLGLYLFREVLKSNLAMWKIGNSKTLNDWSYYLRKTEIIPLSYFLVLINSILKMIRIKK